MRGRVMFLVAILLLLSGPLTQQLHSQQSCPAPPAPPMTPGQNIFNPQQESELGDAVAEHLQRNFRVIDDPEITGYLQRVAGRIIRYLPPPNLPYRFLLFDLPVANAFGLPGGRIYVSRKLVAFTRNEDELAGVLAHELGHMTAHQSAIELTGALREVLGITQVSDRHDILEKYNQLVENIARKPKAFARGAKTEQQVQVVADQIALHAIASAGYSPQAFVDFWDRFAETKGKTGGWLSDLFGATKPESRRLREMLKVIPVLPVSCVELPPTERPEEFQRWQTAVINYSGLGHGEILHAVLARKSLTPPLEGELTNLKFSPDGKHLLAQDDASIYILSREPLAAVFRIDAPEAHAAHFTPDSESVVFYDVGLRVETWSVTEERQIAAHEMVIQRGCLQTALSPDGKILACYGSPPEFTLSLLDVASGTPVFEKKSFYEYWSFQEVMILFLAQILQEGEPDILKLGFSPDGRYFVAAARDETAIAVDLTTRASVPLPRSLKKLLSAGFTFFGSDRLVGVDPYKGANSALVRFPSGDVLDRLPLGPVNVSSATRGDFLLLRPIDKYPVGVMDLSTKKIFIANKKSALDLYDRTFVSERRSGEVGLYNQPRGQPFAVVALPRGPLARLRVAALSPDMKWLALSERDRGGVWNLSTGERVFHVRGFRGAYFSEDGALHADFPKFEQTERMMARLDVSRQNITEGQNLKEFGGSQYGRFLVSVRPAKKGGSTTQDVLLEVHDARTFTVLWSRGIPKEAPKVYVESDAGTLLLCWLASESSAKKEMKEHTEFNKRVASVKDEKTNYLLEALDVSTGKVLGAVAVDTGKGSFRIADAFASGDWVVISDFGNRVLLYSLSSGETKGRFFGRHPAISKSGSLLSLENERGQVIVYDLATMHKRDQFTFSSPVSMMRFTPDGKRLFVLTANQTAYLMDVSSEAQTSSAPAAERPQKKK